MRAGRAARPIGCALLAAVGLAAGLPSPAAGGGLSVALAPRRPAPGDLVLIHVTGAPPDLGAEWNGRPLPLFPVRDGLAALAGVDLDVAPGPLAWRLTRPAGAGRVVVKRGTVSVRPRHFETQRLALPPAQVDLDAATLARVQAERAELDAVLASGAGERLWRGRFQTPVPEGRGTGGFGLRRIINGQPRAPHAGYDWAAPSGTSVLAVNAGRAALVAEQFFAGRLVVLDHGLGLFTLYYHLDEVRVAAGDPVAPGQALGTVGTTGRTTGPHLHFSVILGGARVDPMALLGLVPPPDRS